MQVGRNVKRGNQSAREGERERQFPVVCRCLTPPSSPWKSPSVCVCVWLHTHTHTFSVHTLAGSHTWPTWWTLNSNSASRCAHFARNLARVCLDTIFTSWCFAGCQFPCGRAGLVYSCDPHEHCLCATFTTSPGLQLSQMDQECIR